MRLVAAGLCLAALIAGVAAAQDNPNNERARNWLTVVVDSVNLRAGPAREMAVVGSRFEGDKLEATGRNADGTWFQVTAPYGETPIGWISTALVQYDFEVTLLPLTDTTTGVTGSAPVVDNGVAVVITINARLRSSPARSGIVLQVVPTGVILPVIARNPAGDWLQINYNGQVGWIAKFLTHTVNDLQTLPVVTPGASPSGVASTGVRVISAAMQIAQINRLRAFISAPLQMSIQLNDRISAVVTREIVPCTAITTTFGHYVYRTEDVRQLPELGRYGPSLNQAVDDLNEAISLIGDCGVYSEKTLAQATALLPNRFFNRLLYTLDDLEMEIREE